MREFGNLNQLWYYTAIIVIVFPLKVYDIIHHIKMNLKVHILYTEKIIFYPRGN